MQKRCEDEALLTKRCRHEGLAQVGLQLLDEGGNCVKAAGAAANVAAASLRFPKSMKKHPNNFEEWLVAHPVKEELTEREKEIEIRLKALFDERELLIQRIAEIDKQIFGAD